jgi:hypothetical protein
MPAIAWKMVCSLLHAHMSPASSVSPYPETKDMVNHLEGKDATLAVAQIRHVFFAC